MAELVEKAQRFSVIRLWPLALLGLGVALAFAFGLDRYLSFETLSRYHAELAAFVSAHAVAAALIYLALYIVNTALSLPSATALTLAGGYLFGIWLGTLYTVLGATIGASIVFLAAKTSLGEQLRVRATGALKRMERGFRENALSYLLFLRFVPLFPFFVVNLVPAFLGVPASTFVLGTFIGIVPGTFVYALAGAGLGSVLESDGEFSASAVLTPEVIGAFAGLAVFSLLPVVYKKIRARGRRRL